MAKFMTNRIPLGTSKSFQDILEGVVERSQAVTKTAPAVKTASAKKVEKVAAKDEEKQEETVVDCKKKDDEKDCKCAEQQEATTKVAEQEEAESSGQLEVEPLHQINKENGSGEVKAEEKKDEKKTEASSQQFVKVAKLNSQTRDMLKKYWGNLYPAEYVEAMLAE